MLNVKFSVTQKENILTYSVDIVFKQVPSWNTFHHSHQRVSQSMAHHAQAGETFILVNFLHSPNRTCNVVYYTNLSFFVFSMKAWKFSCQNNRNVRVLVQEAEIEIADPSPLHRLLAHRDLYCGIKRR